MIMFKSQSFIVYHSSILIVFLAAALVFIGCDSSEVTETAIDSRLTRIYFSDETLNIERSSASPITAQLRYEGPKIEHDIEVSFKITYPESNKAVEGEDFILPKSDSFLISKGKAVTSVTLLQNILFNSEAQVPRQINFELMSIEGVQIGDNQGKENQFQYQLALRDLLEFRLNLAIQQIL